MTDSDRQKVNFQIIAPQGLPGAAAESDRRSPRRLAQKLEALDFDAVSSSVSGLVDRMSAAFVPKPGGPTKTEIEFSVSVSVDGSLIVANLGTDVTMRVKVTLDRS